MGFNFFIERCYHNTLNCPNYTTQKVISIKSMTRSNTYTDIFNTKCLVQQKKNEYL